MGGSVIDGCEQIIDASIANTAFDADGTLCRRWQEVFRFQQLGWHVCHIQPLEAGKGQQCRISQSVFQFAQACRYGTTKQNDIEIRSQTTDQCLSA